MPFPLDTLFRLYQTWLTRPQDTPTPTPQPSPSIPDPIEEHWKKRIEERFPQRPVRAMLPPWVTEKPPPQPSSPPSSSELTGTAAASLGQLLLNAGLAPIQAAASLPPAVPQTILGGAVGYGMGGPVGGLAGAILPNLYGLNPELDNALNAMAAMGPAPRMARAPFRPTQTPRVDALINARNTVYHATSREGFKGIIAAGGIAPGGDITPLVAPSKLSRAEAVNKLLTGEINVGEFVQATRGRRQKPLTEAEIARHPYYKEWAETIQRRQETEWSPIGEETPSWWRKGRIDINVSTFLDERGMPNGLQDLKYFALQSGVSVSRVPRIASKESKAISFVIDRSKLPPSWGIAERGYGKTVEGFISSWEPFATPEELAQFNEYAKEYSVAAGLKQKAIVAQVYKRATPPPTPNPLFEFELRTKSEPIPLSAVRGIIIDQSAMRIGPQGTWKDIAEIKTLAAEHGIPVRVLPSGRSMHSSRAALSRLFDAGVPPRELFSIPAAAGLTEILRRRTESERKKKPSTIQ